MGEAVVERVDGRPEARVEQLVAVDVAVVVLPDDVERLLVQAPVGVAHERAADEPGQGVRMPAQPDARDQEDGEQGGEDEGGRARDAAQHGPER